MQWHNRERARLIQPQVFLIKLRHGSLLLHQWPTVNEFVGGDQTGS